MTPPDPLATMIVIAGRLDVPPDDRSGYLDECRDVVRQARAAEGCLDFTMSADPLDAGRINVFERWVDDASLWAFRGAGVGSAQEPRILGADVRKYRIAAVEDP